MVMVSLLWAVLVATTLSLPTTFDPLSISQDLDHYQSPGFDQVTFPQRYWLVDDFWNGSGPVFLYLCGQSSCPGLDPAFLYPYELAKHLHALFISVEHRYYGLSTPPSISSLQPAVPSALEITQVLGDLSELVLTVKREKALWTNKWVVIGGGYAGALAAWFRTRYPGLVQAAWASSATVNPVLDYWQFDYEVYQSLQTSGQHCADSITEMTDFVTRLYQRGEVETISGVFRAKEVFHKDIDQRTVLWMVGDAVGQLVAGGYRSTLCTSVHAGDPMRTLTAVADLSLKHKVISPEFYSSALNQNRTRTDASRLVHWQRCAQLGLFPTPGDFSIHSPLLNLSFYSLFCETVFPYPAPLSPKLPVSLSHLGTKIVYTSGGEDPWQWAGYTGENLPTQEIYSEKIECDDCSHCVDLKTPQETDPIQLVEARRRIAARIASWVT